MTSSHINSLAEDMTNAPPQDRAPNAVTNSSEGQSSPPLPTSCTFFTLTDADPAPSHTPPSQASLLGIPQELRNKIFEYVYGEPDKASGWIKLKVLGPSWVAGTTTGPNLTIDASARIPPSSAPPSKNAILACRQLRIEMSNMQAAAFRRYWSKGTFDTYDYREQLSNIFCAGSDRDLQHARRFVYQVKFRGKMISVRLYFQAGKWIASFCLPDQPWSKMFQDLGKPAPRGFQHLAGFEEAMRLHYTLGALYGGRANMNPEFGLGFTAKDLHVAKAVFRALIRDWVMSLF